MYWRIELYCIFNNVNKQFKVKQDNGIRKNQIACKCNIC